MTVAEFVVWDPGVPNARWWQLVDGEPAAMAPASEAHGAIQAELGALPRNHLLATGGRCRVVMAPGIVPKLDAGANFRTPDLGVSCAPPSGALMLPDPVLLIEIVSPNNEAETWANVWAFASIPSVREILLVHRTRVAAELWRQQPDGAWPDGPALLGAEDALRLETVGFALALAAVCRAGGVG